MEKITLKKNAIVRIKTYPLKTYDAWEIVDIDIIANKTCISLRHRGNNNYTNDLIGLKTSIPIQVQNFPTETAEGETQ